MQQEYELTSATCVLSIIMAKQPNARLPALCILNTTQILLTFKSLNFSSFSSGRVQRFGCLQSSKFVVLCLAHFKSQYQLKYRHSHFMLVNTHST